MLKLTEIAEVNGPALIARYEACHRAKPPTEAVKLESFAECVQKTGQVSINMRPFVLSNLLSNEPHQNMYEWAQEQADLSGRPVTDILREKLRTFYDRRLEFDASFDNGKNFRYGALNIGGTGATNYGQFCVILKPDFPANTPTLVYLRGDSLTTCMETDGTLKEDAVRSGCSRHDHCHHLAAVKHADDVPGATEDHWPTMLCSNTEYIEAIFEAVPVVDDLDQIRVTDTEYKQLFDLAFSNFARKLTQAEAALVNDFKHIRRAERDRRIEIRRL